MIIVLLNYNTSLLLWGKVSYPTEFLIEKNCGKKEGIKGCLSNSNNKIKTFSSS